MRENRLRANASMRDVLLTEADRLELAQGAAAYSYDASIAFHLTVSEPPE